MNSVPWYRLDWEAAAPSVDAWRRGDAMVGRWPGSPPVIHAIETAPFGPTSRLLQELVSALPEHLELRCGPGAAGVLAHRFDLEMVGPFVRLVRNRAPIQQPVGVGPATPGDAVAVRDPDAPMEAAESWTALYRGGRLAGVCGVALSGGDTVVLQPPRLERTYRDAATFTELLDRAAGSAPRVVLDVRIDRSDRISWAESAGFVRVGVYERWWARARE